MNERKLIDIRPVKRLAYKLLGSNSIFCNVLAQERDEIPAVEYCAKLGVWLALLEAELNVGNH